MDSGGATNSRRPSHRNIKYFLIPVAYSAQTTYTTPIMPGPPRTRTLMLYCGIKGMPRWGML